MRRAVTHVPTCKNRAQVFDSARSKNKPAKKTAGQISTGRNSMTKRSDTKTTRRRFLTAAAAGGAVVAMPQVSRAQTVTFKMQGSWSKADVFNEMAEDYVKRVHEMAGNRLRIDY